MPVGRLFETGGARCETSADTLIIDPATFNDTVFRFVATSSVNKEECPESWIEADVSYDASVDCDASGVIDHCQIDAAGGLDLNHDGVLDACEPDSNGNGVPDDMGWRWLDRRIRPRRRRCAGRVRAGLQRERRGRRLRHRGRDQPGLQRQRPSRRV